jgi:hypothetical protein
MSVSERARLRDAFTRMLPKNLGHPYIVNTFDRPYVFVAFYAGRDHEIIDGRIIRGYEFRLLEQSQGFKQNRLLAGIVGVEMRDPNVVFMALRNLGTRKSDLLPYGQIIREMLGEVMQ